jgi:pantoate--beta-alanine ligase
MKTLRTVADVRAALTGPRQAGALIGLVPTMGGFHDGHLALIRRARAECDVVVVSLFVNPTQFNDARDLEAYPRDEARDTRLADGCGVDFLFAPPPEEVYPVGFATTVSVAGITETLEGAMRGRSHFDGVATVVAKLLNIVGPGVAYFGQKDAQQAVVIRRLVADLNFPVRVEVCPTVREPDGLAMSSRNLHLHGEERRRAAGLHRALRAIQDEATAGQREPAAARERGLAALSDAGIDPEYLELVSPSTLAPVEVIDGHTLAVVAARVGGTRLIDNLLITSNGAASAASQHEPTNARATGGAGAQDGRT